MERASWGKWTILLKQWPVCRVWEVFCAFLKEFGIRPITFFLPAILSFLAAIADGASIALLIPLVQGIIGRDFSFIQQQPVLRAFGAMIPESLLKNSAVVFAELILLVFFFAVMKNILCYAGSSLTIFQVRKFANMLRKRVYARYLSFEKMYFDRVSFGHLHQILIGYTQYIANELSTMQHFLFQFFTLLVYVAVGFFISWKLMLFAAIIFPILHFSLRLLISKIRRSSEVFSKANAEMATKISNALSCILLVKAYTNEQREKQWFNYTSDRVYSAQFSIDKKRLIIQPFQEIVGLCITLFLVGFMAFLMAHDKTANIAGFMIFFLVLRRASNNFGVFQLFHSTLAGLWGPLQEIRQIFDDKDKFFVPEGDKLFTGLREKIEFRELSFSYVEDRPVLDRVSFTVRKGETVAIIGSSGSGKTTLAYLLMRFYDNPPGTIFIDGTNIREFTLRSLRSKMALVSQDTFLLNAPFMINLIYGLNREVPKTELEAVLERSRLSQLAKLIGLDAPLGERGVKLSGGERQRLSIARAMLKNAEILVLDEATSSLDTATEALIQAALNEVTANRTVLVIAHRLSTIRNADRILVLEKGLIVENGTPEELLAKQEGYFYFYWQSQKHGHEKELGGSDF